VAARIVRHTQDAADVVQDTFVIALERLRSLRDPKALRGWLLRIAVHQANRRFRRRRLLARLGFVDGVDENGYGWQPSWNAPPDVQAFLSVVERTLLELPARQRDAWILHHVEGETLPVVATACSVSLATVKRDIAAAQSCIRRRVGGGEP
jgi:RNA polymerase sigma-70 factor (ECF subfamily)